MDNHVQVFGFEGANVRIIDQNGDPWFVLKDVCDVLGIENQRNTAARLDEDEKGVRQMDTPGGKQNMTIINEMGLYNVILRSDKIEAKRFKRWVTHDVLPSIRRTGRYEVPEAMRARSKRVRVEFTATLKDHGLKAPLEYIKITTTMKAHAGVKGNKKKDDMDTLELARIEAAEMLARISLLTNDAQGYEECKPICQDAADTVLAFTGKQKGKELE